MPSCTIEGIEGELRWGYFQGAALGAWSLTLNPTGGHLTAKVVWSDASRVTQHPLTFRVVRQKGPALEWPVESLQIVDGTLSARLGLQE